MTVIFLFLLLLMPGCKRTKVLTHFRGNVHTHSYHIQIGQALSLREKEAVATLLHTVFEDIDTVYNHWNPHSELSQINDLKLGEAYAISSELFLLLQRAKNLTTLTEGHFDPTLGQLIHTWKTALQKQTLPSLSRDFPTGWHLFSFEEGKMIRLSEQTQIDLDGLLKGFAIDRILESLLEKGYQNIYVEWGGDMRAVGRHPSGRSWQVGLPFPGKATIPLNMALATSGNATQSLEIEGVRYSHIIASPDQTPRPLLETVSVQAPTCLLADALATALMTFPSARAAREWLERRRITFEQCTVWIRGNEGEVEKWH